MAGQINHIQNEPLGVLIIAIEGSEDIIEKQKLSWKTGYIELSF